MRRRESLWGVGAELKTTRLVVGLMDHHWKDWFDHFLKNTANQLTV